MELAMNEKKEAVIRQQALLMISRNLGKEYIFQKILGRFMKCMLYSKKLPFQINLFKK